MNSERIKMLEQFVNEDPTDPFNRYALGLELMKSDKQRAKEIFDQLMQLDPGYVPSYYQAALLHIELLLNQDAIEIIKKGIVQARRQNNLKAVSELNGLLDETE